MKKLGWVMVFFGVFVFLAGVAFYLLARLNAFEEFFLRSRLTAILQEEDKIVVWSKGRYEDLPLRLREGLEWEGKIEPEPEGSEGSFPRHQGAPLVHFVETKQKIVVFFEEILPPNTIPVRRLEFFHYHGGGIFRIFVVNKFSRFGAELPRLKKVFPYTKMKSIGEWQREVARKGLLFGGISGVAMIILGIMVLALPLILRRGKTPRVIIAEEKIIAVEEKYVPRQKIIPAPGTPLPEAKRTFEREENLILQELNSMIAQSEGDVRYALEKILAEFPNTRGRIKKTRYLFEEARKIFEGGETLSLKEEDASIAAPSSRKEKGLEEILMIEEFIPDYLNPQSVRSLLLWGFLRPTETKNFFWENYLPYESVRGNTVRKGVSPEEFENSFEWLVKIGVVKRAKKGVKNLLYSLNPHPDSVAAPASVIIRAIIRASQELSRRKR